MLVLLVALTLTLILASSVACNLIPPPSVKQAKPTTLSVSSVLSMSNYAVHFYSLKLAGFRVSLPWDRTLLVNWKFPRVTHRKQP